MYELGSTYKINVSGDCIVHKMINIKRIKDKTDIVGEKRQVRSERLESVFFN